MSMHMQMSVGMTTGWWEENLSVYPMEMHLIIKQNVQGLLGVGRAEEGSSCWELMLERPGRAGPGLAAQEPLAKPGKMTANAPLLLRICLMHSARERDA